MMKEDKFNTTIRLQPSLIRTLKAIAKRENRSFTNMVETIIIKHFETQDSLEAKS
jgi:predicted transcriptional regulator